jgi:ribosomal protein S27AE
MIPQDKALKVFERVKLKPSAFEYYRIGENSNPLGTGSGGTATGTATGGSQGTSKGTSKKSSMRKMVCPKCGLIARVTKDVKLVCGECLADGQYYLEEEN